MLCLMVLCDLMENMFGLVIKMCVEVVFGIVCVIVLKVWCMVLMVSVWVLVLELVVVVCMISMVCWLLCDVYMLCIDDGSVVLLSWLISVVILLVGLCGSMFLVNSLVDELSRFRFLFSVVCSFLVEKCCGVIVGLSM